MGRERPVDRAPLWNSIMPANEDRALHLLFRTITPGAGDPADDLIARLVELREAREDFLTEEEYSSWRETLLKQVTGPVGVPGPWRITLGLCIIGGVGLIIYGLTRDGYGAAGGGLAGALVAVYLWCGLERDYRAKRKLGREARLAMVQRLREQDLVTEVESPILCSQIMSAFPADAA